MAAASGSRSDDEDEGSSSDDDDEGSSSDDDDDGMNLGGDATAEGDKKDGDAAASGTKKRKAKDISTKNVNLEIKVGWWKKSVVRNLEGHPLLWYCDRNAVFKHHAHNEIWCAKKPTASVFIDHLHYNAPEKFAWDAGSLELE